MITGKEVYAENIQQLYRVTKDAAGSDTILNPDDLPEWEQLSYEQQCQWEDLADRVNEKDYGDRRQHT